jgi:hypothetical protein
LVGDDCSNVCDAVCDLDSSLDPPVWTGPQHETSLIVKGGQTGQLEFDFDPVASVEGCKQSVSVVVVKAVQRALPEVATLQRLNDEGTSGCVPAAEETT